MKAWQRTAMKEAARKFRIRIRKPLMAELYNQRVRSTSMRNINYYYDINCCAVVVSDLVLH